MGWRSRSSLLLVGVGVVSSLLYILNFRLAPALARLGITDGQDGGLAAYPLLFFVLFTLYALALLVVFRQRSGPTFVGVIVGFAIIFRLALLFAPPVLSTDIYRYIWDGRVQTVGINPYLYPPSAQELIPLRDEKIFPHINRRDDPTIYPPGAEMLLAASAAIFPNSITGLKATMIVFDIGSILLILLLLQKTGKRSDRVLLYAWSPLVIFELAGSGHLEAAMLPFVLLAILARMNEKPGLAGVALGVATLIKLYPAVLFPALYKRRDRTFSLAFGLTILLGYLPYVSGAGGKVLGFLPSYFGPWEDFNVGLRHFVTAAFAPFTTSPRPIAMFLLTALLGAVAVYVLRQRHGDAVVRNTHLMMSAYLILLPTSFHPWYLIWILPLCCVFPSRGWLYLSGAITLSYCKYIQASPDVPLDIRLVEFLPVYVLLGIEVARLRRPETAPDTPMTLMMEKPQ